MLHHSDCVMLWQRIHISVILLHSPSLVAIGLSVGYETWPPIGWHHPFVIGWSKYRLGLPSAPLHYGLMWPVGIPTVSDHSDSPFALQAPAIRAVQWDCERVYSGTRLGLESSCKMPYCTWKLHQIFSKNIIFWLSQNKELMLISVSSPPTEPNFTAPAWKMASGMTIMRKSVIGFICAYLMSYDAGFQKHPRSCPNECASQTWDQLTKHFLLVAQMVPS